MSMRTSTQAEPRAKAIPPSRCISERPANIERREEFGHWEGDLVIFARRFGGANVTSLQERKSRFLMLISNEDKRAATVGKGIGGVLATFPERARNSITFDRGTEFMSYRSPPLPAWFCDPHSPWQKDGVENANGRLRRYLPLESASGDRSRDALTRLAAKLNAVPLSRLSDTRRGVR